MKKDKFKKITKKRISELNEEIINPTIEEVKELDKKMLQLISFKYQNIFKNIDSVKDVAKLFLQLSTSLLVASISFPQLKINIISTLITVFFDTLFMLFEGLRWCTYHDCESFFF